MPYIGNIVQDFSVSTAMLNSDSVTSIKVLDGTLVNADISDSAAIALSKLATGTFPTGLKINTDNILTGAVTTGKIATGTIINGDISLSAAIAGTKVSPDFGSQNVVTTGTLGSSDLTITSAAPALLFTETNGDPDYKIQSNAGVLKIVDNTNSADRLVVNTDGHIDVAGNLDVGAGLDVTGAITTTGNITMGEQLVISATTPNILFTDTNNDPDYRLKIDNGAFTIEDAADNSDKFVINSDGHIDVLGNLDVGAGLDVTGATTLTRSNDNQTTAIITNNGTTGGHCLKLTSGGTGAGTNIFSCFRDNQSSESEVLNVNGSGVLTVTPGASGTVALFASSGSTNGGVLDLRNTQGSNQTFRLGVGGGDNAYVLGRGFFIRDETNSATRLAIDTSGNTSLGTGTPSSGTKLLLRDDSDTETLLLALRNYKSGVNTKPTLRFQALSSTGQGGSSDIQGLAGTDAGAANDNGNDSAMKFIVRHGGAGTLREAFTVKNDGNIHFPNGQGIDFGVTSGGSSSNELFNDYEEGTFTPVIHYEGNASAGQTYNEQQGKYVKVGKFVHFVLRIDINNPGTGDGWVSIGGFPYNMEDMLSGITYEPTVNAELHDAATAVGGVRAMFIPADRVYLVLTTAQTSWFNNANRLGKSTYIGGGTDIRIKGYYMSTT